MSSGKRKLIEGAKKSKAQMSIEYLSIFTAALILLIIVIAIVSTLLTNSKTPTPVTSACYLSAQLSCQQLSISTSNGIASTAILVFTNNLGTTLTFPTNALVVYPTSSQSSFVGACFPTNAIQGSTVFCNATLIGYRPAAGTELNPRFQVSYNQCSGKLCSTFNTSGTSTTYVSANVMLSGVQLFVNPLNGEVTVNGEPYPSGTTVDFLGSKAYDIYASAPGIPNAKFKSWSTSGTVQAAAPYTLATTATSAGQGSLTATFTYPITIAQQPAGASASWDAYFQYQTSDPTDTSALLASQGYAAPGTNLGIGYDFGCGSAGCSPAQMTYNAPTTGVTISQLCTIPASYYSYRYEFTDWGGSYATSTACTSPGFTVKGPATLLANYVVPCYSLTLSTTNGGGAPSASPASSGGCPSGQYAPDTAVTLYANPTSPNWVWDGSDGSAWAGSGSNPYVPGFTTLPPYSSASPGPDGTYSGTTQNPTVIMRENVVETATYTPCYQLELSASPSAGGSPVPSPTSNAGCPNNWYVPGTGITILPNTNPGWQFQGPGSATISTNPTVVVAVYYPCLTLTFGEAYADGSINIGMTGEGDASASGGSGSTLGANGGQMCIPVGTPITLTMQPTGAVAGCSAGGGCGVNVGGTWESGSLGWSWYSGYMYGSWSGYYSSSYCSSSFNYGGVSVNSPSAYDFLAAYYGPQVQSAAGTPTEVFYDSSGAFGPGVYEALPGCSPSAGYPDGCNAALGMAAPSIHNPPPICTISSAFTMPAAPITETASFTPCYSTASASAQSLTDPYGSSLVNGGTEYSGTWGNSAATNPGANGGPAYNEYSISCQPAPTASIPVTIYDGLGPVDKKTSSGYCFQNVWKCVDNKGNFDGNCYSGPDSGSQQSSMYSTSCSGGSCNTPSLMSYLWYCP
ncbi:MAG: hypothetical protein KGH67_05525 [Candidatus Micrarchaeota archaeon]|nr:hypothetical protein [Candidatus Micrarchaeota archaeon]